jgi:hypothetical protein
MMDGEPGIVRAKVLEVRPPLYLAMSWTYRSDPGTAAPPASRVTYTIERAGPENVKLTVVHEEFEPGSEIDDGLRNGWPAILSSLKSFLETGEALDVTKRWAKKGKGPSPVRRAECTPRGAGLTYGVTRRG